MKRIMYEVLPVVVILVLLVLLVVQIRKDPVMFKLDGVGIEEEQFGFYINRHKKEIREKYREQGEEVSPEFWNKTVEQDGTVWEKLKDAAKQDCFREQMILLLAKERGLIDSASFNDMGVEREKENAKRKKAIQKGEHVNGRRAFSMRTYVEYQVGNLTRELIELMEDEELAFQDNELKSYCRGQGYDTPEMEISQIRQKFGYEYQNYLFEEYIEECLKQSEVEFDKHRYETYKLT